MQKNKFFYISKYNIETDTRSKNSSRTKDAICCDVQPCSVIAPAAAAAAAAATAVAIAAVAASGTRTYTSTHCHAVSRGRSSDVVTWTENWQF